MSKRILSVILLALLLLTALLPCVSAADTGTSAYTSVVMQELSGAKIGGKAIDFSDYPKNPMDATVSVIAINETGFRSGADQSDWALYLYLYNPSGRTYDFSTGKCAVTMGYEWSYSGAVTAYAKFPLELVSVSTEEGMENVFLKVRVTNRQIGSGLFTSRLTGKTTRIYAFSELELLLPGKSLATSYPFTRRYEVTGYDKGYGTYASQDNKVIKDSDHDVVQCEPVQTYWRTASSSKGANHRWQVNAVYFAVPKGYFETYDYLQSVKFEWFEAQTKPMIVTDDKTLYHALKPWIGYKVEKFDNGPFGLRCNTDIPYGLLSESNESGTTIRRYGYNAHRTPGSMIASSADAIMPNINPLGWFLLGEGEIKLNQEFIDKEILLDFYDSMVYKLGETAARELLLEKTADDGRTYGKQEVTINFDDTFSLSNYDSNHNWFQKFLDYNLFNGGWTWGYYTTDTGETYDNIKPITVIKSKIYETDDQLAKSMYFANSKEASDFKDYANTALNEGKYVVLLRYAETDYYSEVMEATPSITGTAIVAKQTMFLDFDIIELDFHKNGETIVIPVAANPTNAIGGVQAPQVDNTNPGKYLGEAVEGAYSMLERIAGIALILLGVLVLLKAVQIVVGIFRKNRS